MASSECTTAKFKPYKSSGELQVIKILALHIDGVLTEGKVTLDETGRESKTLAYRDIDAIFEAHRRNLKIVLITGEDSEWVGVIAEKLEIKHVYRGAKDKYQGLQRLCADLEVEFADVCYVGDSARDIEAIVRAGLGFAPVDASAGARSAADQVLEHGGGNGAVADAVEILLRIRESKG